MGNYFQTHYVNIYKNIKEEYITQYSSFFVLNFDDAVVCFDKDQDKCLDLGCGFGNFVYYLKQKGFKNVIGVDIDNDEINICHKEFPDYQFWVDDIFKFLTTDSEKYEIISFFSILEHLTKEEIIRFLRLVQQKLSDKGVIILSTPNMETIFGNTSGRYNDFTHTIGFTYHSLLQALKLSGFNDKEYSIDIFGSPKNKKRGFIFFIYTILSKIALFFTRCYLMLLGYQMPKIRSYALCCVIKKNTYSDIPN